MTTAETLAQPPFGPIPQPTAVSQTHWRAAETGELAVQRCGQCLRYVFNPATTCPYCLSTDLPWRSSCGRGVIHTMTTVHRAPTPGVQTPYVVAVIELEEGWYMLSNIVECAPEKVYIGMPVSVTFLPAAAGVGLPLFKPAAEVSA
ncbi:MAG TPA: Zn-ribbon domain-containing OB-fold protein [Mycobacterium sp.]|jgi:uncharacterized OB-fold protein